MNIPEPFYKIIQKDYSKAKTIHQFFNDCFSDLIEALGITERDYQKRAKATGDMFEFAFWYIIKQKGVELQNSIEIPEACMLGAGALDFGIIKNKKVICGIEAKGSSEDVSGRPALKRTDTVKKAIAQAYQFKTAFPKTPFFVVTNVMPNSGNAKCMLNLAEGDIIDKIVDVSDIKQLDGFVEVLKQLNKS
jgi:hypothetical protein